ncbi:helix-turn-helix domain-containing protein [Streptomyces sp. NPDC057616]|uniref:helix-turn-helix domain-containing protein n=1 Tax=Streptomyces sp. NPDC057616 TaxID=3346183 RepID=UPI0036C01410
MTELDIADVVQRAGVPASTLRFYEEKGLIAASGRRGLRRQYDPAVLDRLALIALGRTAGFSLDEIARMVAPDGRPALDREMLAAKAHELDRTIRELGVLRDSLRHAAACPAQSHAECPTFRGLLAAASSKGSRPGRSRARQSRPRQPPEGDPAANGPRPPTPSNDRRGQRT